MLMSYVWSAHLGHCSKPNPLLVPAHLVPSCTHTISKCSEQCFHSTCEYVKTNNIPIEWIYNKMCGFRVNYQFKFPLMRDTAITWIVSLVWFTRYHNALLCCINPSIYIPWAVTSPLTTSFFTVLTQFVFSRGSVLIRIDLHPAHSVWPHTLVRPNGPSILDSLKGNGFKYVLSDALNMEVKRLPSYCHSLIYPHRCVWHQDQPMNMCSHYLKNETQLLSELTKMWILLYEVNPSKVWGH